MCSLKLHHAKEHIFLVGKSGTIHGAGLRSTDESTQPLIVSIGHKISLETALEVVKMSIQNIRIPIPLLINR